MITFFGKKKITESKLSNILVNSILKYADQGFPEVVKIINNSPEFSPSPNIDETNQTEFILIVLIGNLNYMPNYFDAKQSESIKSEVIEKFAQIFETDATTLKHHLKSYKQFMVRVNHPSKNMIYAMTKGIFFKYGLNDYQEEFFRTQKVVNPIFHKKMDEVMAQFIFDWEDFLKKYKVL